jgi:hypothetical protein
MDSKRSNQPLYVKLTFAQQDHDAYITWASELRGDEVVTPLQLPYLPGEVAIIVRALDSLQGETVPFDAAEQHVLHRHALWDADSGMVITHAHRVVGQQLYAALGAWGQERLLQTQNQSILERRIVSYVLRFPEQAVALAALPWEALESNDGPLLMAGHSEKPVWLERAVLTGRAIPELPTMAAKPPHLLALTPAFATDKPAFIAERQARRALWERLRQQGRLTYTELGPPLTIKQLNMYLAEPNYQVPTIVHYAGHGAYEEEGFLLFDNEALTGFAKLNAISLRQQFAGVPLMMLITCQSAMATQRGLLTGVAPTLSTATGAVVAMQLTVQAAPMVRFVELMYEGMVGRGVSVQQAVADARSMLYREEEERRSWFVPAIYIRSHQPQEIYVAAPPEPALPSPPLPPSPPPSQLLAGHAAPVQFGSLALAFVETSRGDWTIQLTNIGSVALSRISIDITSSPQLPIHPRQLGMTALGPQQSMATEKVRITPPAIPGTCRVQCSVIYYVGRKPTVIDEWVVFAFG